MDKMMGTPDDGAETPHAQPIVSLWRQREYMLLWSGQAISAMGSQVSGLALPLLVLALTHSPWQAGMVSAVGGLPYLVLALPAGTLVDRWSRKWLMVGCDVGRALTLLSIPLALVGGHLTLVQLYLVSLIDGSLFVFFNIAEAASVSAVVRREQLAAATAQGEMIWGLSAVVGPPMGGFLYSAVSRAAPFLIDGVSYLLSAASLLAIRTPFQAEPATPLGSLVAETRTGIRWLWRHPVVRFVALYSAAGDFLFAGVDLVLIVVAQQEMHAAPTAIGFIFTIAAVGGILGALVAPRVQRQVGVGRVITGTSWSLVLLYALFAVAPTPAGLGIVWAGIAFLVSIDNTVCYGYTRQLIPVHLQGRVYGVTTFMAYGSLPLGRALTGLALQALGPTRTVIAVTVCMAGLAFAATLNTTIRHVQAGTSASV